jgi:hypothetical protein
MVLSRNSSPEERPLDLNELPVGHNRIFFAVDHCKLNEKGWTNGFDE